jgi:hypothetical protein
VKTKQHKQHQTSNTNTTATMKLTTTSSIISLALTSVTGFHVDSSPALTRKTYLKRVVKEETKVRPPNDKIVEEYTNDDRQWFFPSKSMTRPVGDTALSALADDELLWRLPQANMVRKSSTVEPYLDNDRAWRQPHEELTRHTDDIPDHLQDEEQFWWKTDDYSHLLLEEDGDHEGDSWLIESTNRLLEDDNLRVDYLGRC